MGLSAKNIASILVAAALSLGGAYLYGRYDDQMTAAAADSEGWPSVTGLVTSSEFETKRRNRQGQHHMVRHYARVTYEYIVDGARYENDVVRFDQNNLSRQHKERLVGAHPVGRQVEVFYNPEKPGQSVLVRGSYP